MNAGPPGLLPLRRVIVDVDRIESAEHLHYTIVLASSDPDNQDRVPAPQAFRVQMRIFIWHGMAFNSRPVVDIAAVVQKLHFGIVNTGSDQRLACGPCALSLLKGGDGT